VAFRRTHETSEILIVAPSPEFSVGFPPVGEKWQDTRLAGDYGGNWRELFTGATRDLGNDPGTCCALARVPRGGLVSSVRSRAFASHCSTGAGDGTRAVSRATAGIGPHPIVPRSFSLHARVRSEAGLRNQRQG
jgi:hypothetical protein